MFPLILCRLLHRVGYEFRRLPVSAVPSDADQGFVALFQQMPQLGTFDLAVLTTYTAVEYIVTRQIPGAIVECGVYQARQMRVIAQTLLSLGSVDRDLYLYDTFSGMTPPSAEDGARVQARWQQHEQPDGLTSWKFAPLEVVQAAMRETRYPEARIHYVVGDVVETLPVAQRVPIALLRLDTDFYASTHAELTSLYDQLVIGGVLIIDDYGRFPGVRQAVDGYWRTLGSRAPMLVRTTAGERVAIKR